MRQHVAGSAPVLCRLLWILFLVVLHSTASAGDWIDRVVRSGKVGNGYEHGQFPSWGNRTHPGVDIGGGCGLEVLAPSPGAVVRVVDGNDPRFSSVGNAIVIQHSGGETPLFTTYFHLQSAPVVKIGLISEGQLIGYTGETGDSADGCHLHFEVRRFDGIDRLFHPEFKNIYLSGDQRDSTSFRTDWLDPTDWLTARSQIEFGIWLATGAKSAVSDYFNLKGFFPSSNRETNIAAPSKISMRAVSSVEVKKGGTITITFGGESVPEITGKTVVLTPSYRDGSVDWFCRTETVDKEFLPTSCQ